MGAPFFAALSQRVGYRAERDRTLPYLLQPCFTVHARTVWRPPTALSLIVLARTSCLRARLQTRRGRVAFGSSTDSRRESSRHQTTDRAITAHSARSSKPHHTTFRQPAFHHTMATFSILWPTFYRPKVCGETLGNPRRRSLSPLEVHDYKKQQNQSQTIPLCAKFHTNPIPIQSPEVQPISSEPARYRTWKAAFPCYTSPS